MVMVNCGPGDLGVDEDYSEQFITDLVNMREIYLIPMLNVDGANLRPRGILSCSCMGVAWAGSGGWRKNLSDNTFTGGDSYSRFTDEKSMRTVMV